MRPILFLLPVACLAIDVPAPSPDPALKEREMKVEVAPTATRSPAVAPAPPRERARHSTPALPPSRARSPKLLGEEISKILEESYRFHQGARVSTAQGPVVRPWDGSILPGTNYIPRDFRDEAAVRRIFEMITTALGEEDPELREWSHYESPEPSAEAFEEEIDHRPTVVLTLRGTRPLVITLDFEKGRALVMYHDRWTVRKLAQFEMGAIWDLPAAGEKVRDGQTRAAVSAKTGN